MPDFLHAATNDALRTELASSLKLTPDNRNSRDTHAAKWLVWTAAVSTALAFVAIFALVWAKWGLVTFMKMDIWSICF